MNNIVDNNINLTPSTGWIDTDELRRASGNALHMAYQVFNLGEDDNNPTIDPMTPAVNIDFDYPKPSSSNDYQQYTALAGGSVGTLARNMTGAALRPVRRVPIYKADFNHWRKEYSPKPNVSRLEWKTDALKWPDKYGFDPDMNSDCPYCDSSGCNNGPINPSPFGACYGSRGNDANGDPVGGCHVAQEHNCEGNFHAGVSCTGWTSELEWNSNQRGGDTNEVNDGITGGKAEGNNTYTQPV